MSDSEEVLTGSFQGYGRLDLCVLNLLKRESAVVGDHDDRRRLEKLRRFDPPLVSRRGWLPWRSLYAITHEGRQLLSAFGRNPHFEWEDVPGVSQEAAAAHS